MTNKIQLKQQKLYQRAICYKIEFDAN